MLEGGFGLPTESAAGLAGITEEIIDFSRTEIERIDYIRIRADKNSVTLITPLVGPSNTGARAILKIRRLGWPRKAK